MWIDPATGLLDTVEYRPSPNCDHRPDGLNIDLIVIHGISLPPGQFGGPFIDDLFLGRLDPGAHPYFAGIHQLRVSAHCLIRRDGELVQYVPFTARAWHAGVSSWEGREACNDFSIGIELEGLEGLTFESAQYEALGELCGDLLERYPLHYVAGHEHIAPGRKQDPGPGFDWAKLGSELPVNILELPSQATPR